MAPRLEVREVSFHYEEPLRSSQAVIKAVSFTADAGEWLAIVGMSGSGKTTLAKLLAGLLTPAKGEIRIDGQPVQSSAAKRSGIVFQNPEHQFIGATVQDDIAFGLENMNMAWEDMKRRVEIALDRAGLSDYRHHDPSRLSSGLKQRAAIAAVLAMKPAVVILDEAFVMLDPRNRRELSALLRGLAVEEGIAVISITHDMDEAAQADRILMMADGRIIEDAAPERFFTARPEAAPPFAEAIRRRLRSSEINKLRRNKKQRSANEVPVPDFYMTEDELVEWLCRSR